MKIFNKLEEWLGGALFLVIFCILIAQILSRQVFQAPLIWSEELAKLLFVYVGMLGISVAVRKQEHVYIDFLTNLMPAKVRKISNTFVQLIIFVCIFFFIHFGIRSFNSASFPIDALGGISEKWIFAALPVIAALMMIRFFQAQAQNFKEDKSYLPVSFFIISAVILLAILFFAPDWFKVLRITSYVNRVRVPSMLPYLYGLSLCS
ncbi:sialic acid TRAP transporter permease protein SiaT-2 [Rodentibacter pneumotropicus]|uniref:TRAP transporter small permease protein n=1 Tax=Rodentibacter pneumotropicus TaxID=758 RepID=A0A3S4URN1_9PAST|nr:sialic acid TRAP transporter permease protein SiaT-2 [Rodentibacter pneumotropicus]